MRPFLAALALGCAGIEPAPVEVEPSAPEPVVHGLDGAWAATRDVRLQVRSVTVHPQEVGAIVTLDVIAHYAREPWFDGIRSNRRRIRMPVEGMRLVGDGEAVVLLDPAWTTIDDRYFAVPAEMPGRARGDLAFSVPWTSLPDPLWFVADTQEGTAEVLLHGQPRMASGQPAVAMHLLDPTGRPVSAPGTLTTDGGPGEQGIDFVPWRVPASASTWSAELEGMTEAEGVLGDDPVQRVVLRPGAGGPVEDDPMSWPTVPWVPGLDAEVDLPDGVDGAHEAVRETIGILATPSVQRGPTAVMRLGAGSPIERAWLLAGELKGRGETVRVVCGDLPEDQVEALYRDRVDLPPLVPPLATAFDRLRGDASALRGELAPALSGASDRERGLWTRAGVVPEWCWVQHQPAPDAPFRDLDLRPIAVAQGVPLPAVWRVAASPSPDTWWAEVQVSAGVRVGDEVEDRLLVQRRVTVPSLTDNALMVDIYPTPEGQVRAHMIAVAREDAAGEVSGDVPAADLDRVVVTVRWSDPHGVHNQVVSRTVWQERLADGPPRTRALFSMASADPSGELALDALAQARAGVHPIPAAAALWARHRAYDTLALHLAEGVPALIPQLRWTVLDDLGDGKFTEWFDVSPASPPAWDGGPPGDSGLAQITAADTVARAAILGVKAPGAPTAWLRGDADRGGIPSPATEVHAAAQRMIEDHWLGASDHVWQLDRVTGGLVWFGRTPYRFEGVVAEDPASDDTLAERVHRRWDRPLRCREVLRWAAWDDRDAPTACRPPEPPVAP